MPHNAPQPKPAPLPAKTASAISRAITGDSPAIVANEVQPMPPILNREGRFAVPEDGFFHLVPLGEYPHESGVVQVIDQAAVANIAGAFREASAAPRFAGVLIDQEHFSLAGDKSGEAMGWVTDLAAREDGLWGRVRWTDTGQAAVENGRFRFISPVWLREDCDDLGNGRVRPRRLHSLGLTNSPNLKGMAPLSNRAASDATPSSIPPSPSSSSLTPGTAPGAAQNKPKANSMTDLNKLLGLAEDAAPEAVLAAVTALKNRAEAAEADLLKNREAQADADLEPLKDKLGEEDRKAIRAQLVANRAATLPLLRLAAAKAAPAPGGKASPLSIPAQTPADALGNKDTHAARARAYQLRNRCTYADAWEATRNPANA